MNGIQNGIITQEEIQLLEEWIKQIEELKNDLQMMQKEGQCGIIISDIASKLTKIHTGMQLWKTKNIDKGI
jgi:hypothetical protein